MTRVSCNVNACSYQNGGVCSSQIITIGSATNAYVDGPSCGSFLNRAAYSNNINNYMPSSDGNVDITCVAVNCTHNCSGCCVLEKITVGGDPQAQIYTQTECMLFKNI